MEEKEVTKGGDYMSNENNTNKKNTNQLPTGLVVTIIVLIIIGTIGMIINFRIVFAGERKCAKTGCTSNAADGSSYCYLHKTNMTKTTSKSSGSSTKTRTTTSSKKTGTTTSSKKSVTTTSSKKTGTTTRGKKTGTTTRGKKTGTSTKKKTGTSTTKRTVDPMDHDIDTYYEDYKNEFEDEDDALPKIHDQIFALPNVKYEVLEKRGE